MQCFTWQEKRVYVAVWRLLFPEPGILLRKRWRAWCSAGGDIPWCSSPVLSLIIEMYVIIMGLTELLSQCVQSTGVDWTCPNHCLLCKEKLLFYHSVCQCKWHSKFSFWQFDWCRKLHDTIIFHNAFLSDAVRERVHMMLGLLRSTKPLCCS